MAHPHDSTTLRAQFQGRRAEDQWVLGEEIGRGGGGVVRAAVHRADGRHAAVKRVPVTGLGEAVVIAGLDHPNVVAIHDAGIDDQGGWIAMERAAGVATARDLAGLHRVLDGLLAGLAASHARGVLHLDVKPGNLLVRADGTPVLADFGLARGADGARLMAGTPGYMAPEAFDGRPDRLTPATDLYGVGCLATALLTGVPPYPTQDWSSAARLHRLEPIPELAPRFPVPAALVVWVRRLLEKAPRARFVHAADARVALRRACEADVAVAIGGSCDFSPTLTATIQATRAGDPVPIEALLGEEPEPAVQLPERWEDVPAGDPRNSGAGLLGLREPPFTGRREQRDRLWSQLGRPGRVGIVGPPGSGRTRLGTELAFAAAAAGCRVLWGCSVASLRRALWLADDASEEALALRVPPHALDAVRAGLKGDLHRALAALDDRPLLVWLDEDDATVEGALVVRTSPEAVSVELPPFDAATCRSVLSRWVGLSSDTVSAVAELVGGELGLAIEVVRHGVRTGALRNGPQGLVATATLELPPAVLERWRDLHVDEALLEAAAEGLQVTGPRIEALRSHGLLVAGDRWVSAAARAAVLEGRDPRPAHRQLAAELQDATGFQQVWRRGLHHLRAGDLDPALDDLFAVSTDMNGAGKMVEVGRVLDELEQAMVGIPRTDVRWGWLYRYQAQLGPTHRGVAYCEDRTQRVIDLARDTEEWTSCLRNTLGGHAWLCNVLRLPLRTREVLDRLGELHGDHLPAATLNSWGYQRLYAGDARAAAATFELANSRTANNPYMALITRACWLIPARWMRLSQTQQVREEVWAGLQERGYHAADADMRLAEADWHRWWGELDDAERCAREALAISAQGEVRSGPSFQIGMALVQLEQGDPQAALDRLIACEETLQQNGPAWQGLTALHRLAAEAALGLPLDTERLARAEALLTEAGYHDPDLVRSCRRIGAPASQLCERLQTVLRAGGAVL